jgi:hypothetical protein
MLQRLQNSNNKYDTTTTTTTTAETGIRDDLYDFWFVEMEKSGNCDKFNSKDQQPYKSGNHTGGLEPAIDRCFELLNESSEYNYLREMFLIEYEKCMNSAGDNERLKNFFNTFCLDAIAIRRLLIEYETCCVSSKSNNNETRTAVTSTICSLENFNTKFIGYKVDDLIRFVKNSGRSNRKPSFGHVEIDRLFFNLFSISFFVITKIF